MSLESLRKSQGRLLEKLVEETQKLDQKTRNDDDRYWQITEGSDGNGSAVIRFLPAPEGEDMPWVRYYSHSFKNEDTGKWYIEKSLTTIGKKDPVGDRNSDLWNKGGESGKAQARAQKRTENFVSNILVIKDPGNPENEGKVFLFRFGKKIFEKIKNVMTPDEDAGEEGYNPFDPWDGSNFIIKIKKVSGFRNYDDSKFAKQTVLGDDFYIESVWGKTYSLASFTDPSTFKTYEELQQRLSEVLGEDMPFMRDEKPKNSPVSAKVEKKTQSEKPKEKESDDIDMSDIDNLLEGIDLDSD